MIAALIRASLARPLLVLLVTALVTAAGVVALLTTPVDAIPDLSDTQVIVRTTWPGQAPQVVEDQVTYPLTTTLMSVPHVRAVRGFSLFGESFVYVLFDDSVDLYWARSRVLEYLSQAQGRLPATARTALGPDATGVGWIYEYALVDRSGGHDIGELRALQDWFLRYELKSLPDVAEVATVGGQTRQFQIVLDPVRLRAHGLTLAAVVDAVQAANNERGGSVLELAEAEYIVRARGYLRTLDDFRAIPLAVAGAGTPILLGDVATIQVGPEMRRGIAELDGDGEVVGGVIVLRSGGDARAAIAAVKERLSTLAASLPPGVAIVETYDRSALIQRAIANLSAKLGEELAVVAIVCAAFLLHARSALVAVVTLPIGILVAFLAMRALGINANIMSLGGIAIAIGAMVDAAVVMVENAHRLLAARSAEVAPLPGETRASARDASRAARDASRAARDEHRALITRAAVEVGPALFGSLLIITLSFVPVFLLEAQEGRLFAPLAATKTWAMAAAAVLSVTLIPVLMLLFVRGRIAREEANPLNRVLVALYRPLLARVLAFPRLTLLVAAGLLLATLWPALRLGSEFMPPLDEGDILYMPSALPSLSAAKASQLLQQTDRILKTFPEVERVFGKAGRADTATDPAPLEMFETTIRLKPQSQWRPGLTLPDLIAEMDAALKLPGIGNVWVQPIRNRIDMLATGIKSPVGVKITGPELPVIERIGADVEAVLRTLPDTASAFAERVSGGRYIDIEPDRLAAARHGLAIADIQRWIGVAVGGENVGEVIDGLQRFPINVRYPRELRDSLADLRDLPIVTANGATLTLGMVARINVVDGPPLVRSENARPAGFVFVDVRDSDLGGYVAQARRAVAERVTLPTGYALTWSGQYEYLERAALRLAIVVPFTLALIFVLLYLTFGRAAPALLILSTLPFALLGGLWLLYALGHHVSVASAVGFIALAGLAAEFGVVMLIYLDLAIAARRQRGNLRSEADLRAAITDGAVLRVRPKAMTVAVIIAGLVPLFVGAGAGSEVMQRIAAPMLGGMISAPLLSMLVLPAAYLLWLRRGLPPRHDAHTGADTAAGDRVGV